MSVPSWSTLPKELLKRCRNIKLIYMKTNFIILFCLICSNILFGQGNPPWERPLKISTSTDGQNFTPAIIFQDSSGVPSLIKWKGDTLACVFQWFRQPMASSTWDKVAVKFSYDNGLSWTQPVPITINGFPTNYQRPFDPTLAVINSDSLRIFYSSSVGMPQPGGDSIIDTHSAVSTDGINFTFEQGPRYDNSAARVIDPAAIIFNNLWHYAAPIGAPQDGAYHCTSGDGINFSRQADYLSDQQHNWTGNFMIYDSGELRFYGSGAQIWYKSSPDGFNYSNYVNTNLFGGDPSVVRVQNNNFIAIYVGEPYTTSVNEIEDIPEHIFPNPAHDFVILNNSLENSPYTIFSSLGKAIKTGVYHAKIDLTGLPPGLYFLLISQKDKLKRFQILKAD